jgi:hypothetical protein
MISIPMSWKTWELEKGKENFGYGLKGSMGVIKVGYMYHLEATPIKVHWKSINLIESSIMELEEHQRWKDMIWLEGSSPGLPSNLGISKGSFLARGTIRIMVDGIINQLVQIKEI